MHPRRGPPLRGRTAVAARAPPRRSSPCVRSHPPAALRRSRSRRCSASSPTARPRCAAAAHRCGVAAAPQPRAGMALASRTPPPPTLAPRQRVLALATAPRRCHRRCRRRMHAARLCDALRGLRRGTLLARNGPRLALGESADRSAERRCATSWWHRAPPPLLPLSDLSSSPPCLIAAAAAAAAPTPARLPQVPGACASARRKKAAAARQQQQNAEKDRRFWLQLGNLRQVLGRLASLTYVKDIRTQTDYRLTDRHTSTMADSTEPVLSSGGWARSVGELRARSARRGSISTASSRSRRARPRAAPLLRRSAASKAVTKPLRRRVPPHGRATTESPRAVPRCFPS